MADQGFKRKLAAILSADVKGYSRLMGDDEDATIRTLTTYRDLMSTLIQKHRGRVVDSPGDNLLAEFGSVVDAVRCAVEIQEELRVGNAELPDNRKMQFRIGINLGDVVEEGERIYGDGVNIAARVEGLAEGGGICISGTVYDSIKNKLTLRYESIGEHTVKNIKEPVRVYRMWVGPEAEAPTVKKEKAGPKRRHWAGMSGIALLIILIAAVAIWNLYLRRPSIEPASVERMAFPLPDKPSIAVLPFTNMSGDPKQEFFCDGLTEEVITALSKSPELFVIARNSSFTYKGKPVKVQKVSEELGVRYVLEGSVRRADDRVRITAQLIDAISGKHLWAERYDRSFQDIFFLQDDITISILEAMQIKLTYGEIAREVSHGTKNLDAYLKVLEAYFYMFKSTPESFIQAKKLLDEAIILDPEYAQPYVFLGIVHSQEAQWGFSKSPDKSIMEASKLAQKGLEMDDSMPQVHELLGNIFLISRQYDKAIASYDHAIELAPNNYISYVYKGMTFCYMGHPKKAIPVLATALRGNPKDADMIYQTLGVANEMMGSYEKAIEYFLKAKENNKFVFWPQTGLLRSYIALGQIDKAHAAAAEVLRLRPNFSARKLVMGAPWKDQAEVERMVSAYLKAGLPE